MCHSYHSPAYISCNKNITWRGKQIVKLLLCNYCVYPSVAYSCLCSNILVLFSNLFSIYDLHSEVRYDVLPGLSIKLMVIWDVMPCNLVWMSTKVLMEFCCLYLQGGRWRAVSPRTLVHMYGIVTKKAIIIKEQVSHLHKQLLNFGNTLGFQRGQEKKNDSTLNSRKNFLHLIFS